MNNLVLGSRRGLALALCFFAALACPAIGLGDAQPIPTDAMVKIDGRTKMVIKGALRYLASKQHLDGSWSIKEGLEGQPVAMTGYVLLAFLSTANLPDEGEYSKNVAAGMRFLLDSIQPDGTYRNVSGGQYMYNHAIATIALAELYGEVHVNTKADDIRPRLERAISVILKAQSPSGGWRYSTHPGDADISVTVMQAVALRAAQECGIAVPQDCIDKAIGYVKSCYEPKQGGFSYQPGSGAGFARTAAAIYSLQVLGKYDDPLVKSGSAYLFANLKGREWFTYGNYYAAPAQYMIGGDTWRNWYAQMKQILLGAVHQEGNQAYWGLELDGNGQGPIFTTAVYTHILAMPYHFVPLYQR